MKKYGKIIDVVNRKIFNGCITIEEGRIVKIEATDQEYSNYILPGFVDAHIHIESSMLIPSRFATLAVKQGTIAIVNDPHEIANVLDVEGVEFMIEDSKKSDFKFYFGAPSCVPATDMESSGGNLDSQKVKSLLERDEIVVLSEVMNFPGVIYGDKEVHAKINAAKSIGKPIDGHAPGLTGKDLDKYISAGIQTDHEAYSYEEGKEKLEKGMYILVREGSAAKNFDSLYKLIDEYPEKVMLCTDDSHPDNLSVGHINKIIAKGLNKGVDLFNLLRAATYNPKKFYNLDIGLLQEGDPADFVVLEDLESMIVKETYINGKRVFFDNNVSMDLGDYTPINKFRDKKINEEDLKVISTTDRMQVIKCYDGELITDKDIISVEKGVEIKTEDLDGINKIVVVNRYDDQAKPQVAFISGFGLKDGAVAMSIAHDSHNIIAVGNKDSEITAAINRLIENKGGIVLFRDNKFKEIKLEVAGLMTGKDPIKLAEEYKEIEESVKEMGSKLKAPLMTLSFMALLVIPKLKLSDKGLFDGESFNFTEIFI